MIFQDEGEDNGWMMERIGQDEGGSGADQEQEDENENQDEDNGKDREDWEINGRKETPL